MSKKTEESSGLFLYNKHTKHFLLLRAYKNWSFPKGNIDDGESTLDAAKRETKEETGIDIDALKGNPVFIDKIKYINKEKYLTAFYFEFSSEKDLPVKLSWEHHEYRWVSFDELNKLVNYNMHPFLLKVKKLITES